MARHDQRPVKKHMTCSHCLLGECERCVDVTRFIAGYKIRLCQCTRKGHEDEPSSQQILDPQTGTVYAPGLEVSVDGQVTFNDPRCQTCHFRHKPTEECITL